MNNGYANNGCDRYVYNLIIKNFLMTVSFQETQRVAAVILQSVTHPIIAKTAAFEFALGKLSEKILFDVVKESVK